MCRCGKRVVRCGQDESIFKANAVPRGFWAILGVVNMRKKTEGVGEMASYFVDEELGLGLKLTDEQLDEVNAFRARRTDGGDKSPLLISPGERYLKYGKDKEGYWGYEDICKQAMDVLDVYETLMPDRQVVMELDWSSGHAKQQEDGLAVNRMNLRCGMARKTGVYIPKTVNRGVADAGVIMEEGCYNSAPGAELHNVKAGGRQRFAFSRTDAVNPVEADADWVPEKSGTVKGVLQILWERGFDIQDANGKTRTLKDLRSVLGSCHDFKNEVGELELRVMERGHILLMSPKGHPEVAGCGIEFAWAKAKNDFRRDNPMSAAWGKGVEDLHDRVVKSLRGIDILMMRRFARKARDYMRGYARHHGLFGWDTEEEKLAGHREIEKFMKDCKTHRCILDQDRAFATSGGLRESRRRVSARA